MSDDAGASSVGATGRDPDADRALTDPVNWAAFSHRDLFAAVHHNNQPAQGQELSREWTGLADEADEAAAKFEESVRRSQEGWQGEAAEAARAHLFKLARRGTELAGTGREIGACLAEQSTVMERAKYAMPEPLNFDLNEELHNNFATPGLESMVASASGLKPLSDAVNARHQQAVDVMVTMEADSRAVDEKVPGFTALRMRTGQGEESAPVTEPAQASSAATPLSAPPADHMPETAATGKAAQPISAAPSGGELDPPTVAQPISAASTSGQLDPPTVGMKPVTAAAPDAANPAEVSPASTSNASALPPQMPQHSPPQPGTPGTAPTTASSSGGVASAQQQWSRNQVAPQTGQRQRVQGDAREGTTRIPRPGDTTRSSLDAPTKKFSIPKRGDERKRSGDPESGIPETPQAPVKDGPPEAPPGADIGGNDGSPSGSAGAGGAGNHGGMPGGSPGTPDVEPPKPLPFHGEDAPASFSGNAGSTPSTTHVPSPGEPGAEPGYGAAAVQRGVAGGSVPSDVAQDDTSQSGAMGGMPRGAPGGGMQQGGQDTARDSRRYLQDESIVDQPQPDAPAVFGEKFKKKS